MLAPDPEAPRSEEQARTEGEGRQFEAMILDNLRKAGVQNTRRNERLKLDTLEPYAGVYLHARGVYTESGGETRRVAVSIGPEFGTVGADWMKEAAKEAMRGAGFDLLVVCGFSFDGYASEESRQFGALTVLPVRMNNDLSMGDELLKKTGAGNLFMAFAEPDIEIRQTPPELGAGGRTAGGKGQGVQGRAAMSQTFPELEAGEQGVQGRAAGAQSKSPSPSERSERLGEAGALGALGGEVPGQITVEIKGMDVYDPTTGQIRSGSTDDIAVWFIDTDYDGESFFVRHAYFLGAGDPYEKLKRALRAQIDEAAWSQLYSAVSRPFPPPSTGRIAIKVINHYGDEVLKVYNVAQQ